MSIVLLFVCLFYGMLFAFFCVASAIYSYMFGSFIGGGISVLCGFGAAIFLNLFFKHLNPKKKDFDSDILDS
ncbi:hypothetical protein [Aureispira anguillae]|uniref:Uncharacterized protein n=1 Tax=Aureispira anguillae TaxID=2864201 RepID=A0A916DQJ0_9BACT|nr:hypothetical protein [Aureispira anguillae]BDS10120.1 hypothetical protein AsAng_0008270 [Aureispira anguillae]